MQFDLFSGEPRRQSRSGATVADWIADGLLVAERHLPFGELMGEEFRRLPVARPPSPKWWGLLVQAAVKAQIIRPTERFAKAESAANHAHHYRIYVRSPLHLVGGGR
jgi:hypothetical protein